MSWWWWGLFRLWHKNEPSLEISTHISNSTHGQNGHGLGCVQQRFDGHEQSTLHFSKGLCLQSPPLSVSTPPLSNTSVFLQILITTIDLFVWVS